MTRLPFVPRARCGSTPVALLSLLALAGACELPTAIPKVDQRWVVPAPSATLAVATLLPSGVGITTDSSGFTVSLPGISVTRALSQDCPACVSGNGTTVPKPAFTATASGSVALPAGIASATLTAGALTVVVKNNYNFDPLRPSATANGYAVIAVTNNGVQLGRDSVNGATTAFPAGATLTRTIQLRGTVTSAASVVMQLTLVSPAGDPITLDASRTIVITATPSGLVIGSASITVSATPVSSSSNFDLSGIDSSITKRVDAGSLQLDLANPFTVSGTLTVQLTSPGMATISKSVSLTTGTTHPVITFTQDEVRALLGKRITLTISGPVSGTGPVAVSPKQAVVVTSRLDLTLHTGD